LLRRIREECGVSAWLEVELPIHVKSASLRNDHAYFRKYILLAAAKAAQRNGGTGWVLILLDCEDECPDQLGPLLLKRAQAVRSDVDYVVALAYREYESWFSPPLLPCVANMTCLAISFLLPISTASATRKDG
jgi:hypothetical protein